MTTPGGGRPSQPSDGASGKPAVPTPKPAGLGKPAVPTPMPAGPKPAGSTPKPAASGKPAVPTPKPAGSAPKPSVPTPKPAGVDGAVVAPAGTPLINRQRKVRMTVNQVDPWTVLRLSFLLSVAAAIITVVAVVLLWTMLQAAGVFGSVDETLQSVLGDGALTITQYFSFMRVFSIALLIGAIDVVLITALATIGAFLYNLASSLTGGLEMTVTEDT